MTIVSALVISQAQYCLTIYGDDCQRNDWLQKKSNFYARVIFDCCKLDHMFDFQDILGWMSPKLWPIIKHS